jgi:hypothetical protein
LSLGGTGGFKKREERRGPLESKKMGEWTIKGKIEAKGQ